MGSPIDKSMPHPNDKRIWRYMDLAKYLDLLRTRSLYLPSLTAFEDKWEGATGPYNLDRDVANHLGIFEGQTIDGTYQMMQRMEATAEAQRGLTYVSCWHANDAESEAMWKLYGATGNAIAIESTIDRLAEIGPPETDGPSAVMAVRYFDLTRRPLPHEDAFNLFARASYKRPSFQHEEEIRLIHYLMDDSMLHTGENTINLAKAPKGRSMAADLERLVSRVVISPAAPTWFRDVVVDATAKYGFTFAVDESEMLARPTYGTAHYPPGPAPTWGPEGRFGLSPA